MFPRRLIQSWESAEGFLPDRVGHLLHWEISKRNKSYDILHDGTLWWRVDSHFCGDVSRWRRTQRKKLDESLVLSINFSYLLIIIIIITFSHNCHNSSQSLSFFWHYIQNRPSFFSFESSCCIPSRHFPASNWTNDLNLSFRKFYSAAGEILLLT